MNSYAEGIIDYYANKITNGILVVAFILAPLGVWKLVEIIVWLFTHINITIKP
jgi:hypothetical protein